MTREEMLLIALHDAIETPAVFVPESASQFYSESLLSSHTPA